MLKSELVAKLAEENPELQPDDIRRVVDTVLDTIVESLARGDHVEIRRFGSFFATRRKARIGRNPRNSTPVSVPEKRIPMFRASKRLRERVDS